MTRDGTEIVGCFGVGVEMSVPDGVEILGKSCFESCDRIGTVVFGRGSRLIKIAAFAFSHCDSLSGIEIPGSVEVIDENAFDDCVALQFVALAKNSALVCIGAGAFSDCIVLRVFDFPGRIEKIGRNCFESCDYLHQLRFESGESLERLVGDRTLDETLEEWGVTATSSLFGIDVKEGNAEFPGWTAGEDGRSHLTLVRDLQ
jgi:hypothetical protein